MEGIKLVKKMKNEKDKHNNHLHLKIMKTKPIIKS
jgi:hypothetical protein